MSNFIAISIATLAFVGLTAIGGLMSHLINKLISWITKINRTIKRMDDMYSKFYDMERKIIG